MQRIVIAFLAGLIVMGSGGYWWLHRQSDPLEARDEPARQIDRGLFRKTETIAVGEVVNGISQLNRLVVFQAYVTSITTTHDIGWLTQTDQTMLTPAFVNYYIDMGTIDGHAVRVRGKDIYVRRPAIMIERPNIDVNNVRTFNEGIWSNLASVNDRLRVKNNKMALTQLVGRAKMPFLVKGARDAALAAEEVNVRRILAASGHTDVTVHITD